MDLISSANDICRLLAVLLCSAPASLVGPASASAAPPTGDPQAIALNREVQNRYSVLPGFKVVQRGLLFARPIGQHDHDYVAGRKKGYKAATETAAFALSDGKVTAYLDSISASGMGRFLVLVDSNGVFRSELATGGCWHPAPSNKTTFGRTGRAFVDLEDDHYFPLEQRGSRVISRLTYRTGPVKATVAEAINPTTHEFVSARWTYKTRHYKVSFTQKYASLSSVPAFPKPAPIC